MMTEIERQRRILEGAISHMRCILREPWQSVESKQIARENIAAYKARLATLN